MRPRALHLGVLSALFLLIGLLAWVPARNANTDASQYPFRVGLVFDVGGRGDKSFNDAAYRGLLKANKELHIGIEVVEPQGAEDREAALRLFAARKFQLVIGVGFIFSRDIDTVAADYPFTRFACVDYAPPIKNAIASNVTGLSFREHEGSFLVGAVAALTSRSKKVGFIGGMDIPLIHKFEAGYRSGVLSVCTSCKIFIAYAGSTPDAFRDPAKGKSLALSQIAQGADVLFHASGSTGHGVFEASKESQTWAIGVDSDQFDEAPSVVLTSMVKQADVAVFDAIEAAKNNTLQGGMRELGLQEQGVDYIRNGPHAKHLRESVKERVEQLRLDVIAKKINVPTE